MSYEFFARMPEQTVRISQKLLSALTRRLPLALVSLSKDKLSLRWTDIPRRAEWPEDVDLLVNAEGILISIHVGTADQRGFLLEVLTEELAKTCARHVTFEEL